MGEIINMGEIISANDIKNDVNKMKDYLKDIYTLEKEAYCSRQAENKINNTINGLGIAKTIERPYSFYDFWDVLPIIIGTVVVGGICSGIGYFLAYEIEGDYEVLTASIVAIIAIIIGISLIINSKNQFNREAKQKRDNYERQVDDDRERVNRELELADNYRRTGSLYSQNISSCQEALNQLYSLDIIFPKYRNFVAIAQIYEYYMSGRCVELEGHEGAYNVFENELRQNVIISQLNDVLYNLEEIKNTQYMIYDALCEANNRLSRIESNTEAIAYNTSVIAENSAITAKYAQRHL